MTVGQAVIELPGQGGSQDQGRGLLLLRQGKRIVRHVVVQIIRVGAFVFSQEKGVKSCLDFGLKLYCDIGILAFAHALQALGPFVQRVVAQTGQRTQGGDHHNGDKQESSDHGSYL